MLKETAAEIAEWVIAVAFSVAMLMAFHCRSRFERVDSEAAVCPTCQYPRVGLPPSARCPECNAEYRVVKPRVRRVTLDRPGFRRSVTVLASLASIQFAGPYIWMWMYHAHGWTAMRATDRPCAFECGLGTWQALITSTLLLPLASRFLPGRSRWTDTACVVIAALIWIAVLWDRWQSGAIHWSWNGRMF